MKNLLFVSAAFLLASCAHHRDVRPSMKGMHKVKFQTEDQNSGYSNAKSQADHFCEKRGKTAYIGKEGYKYSGDMDESTYKKSKTASKVAQGVGGAAYVFGGKKESNAGGILGLGGSIADGVIGKGYTYTMYFQCK